MVIKCPSCGTEIKPKDTVCSYCGLDFASSNVDILSSQLKEQYGDTVKKGSRIFRILVGIPILLIGLFGLFVSLVGIIHDNTTARNYQEVSATYIKYEDNNELYTGIYEYEVNGTKYEKRCGSVYDKVEDIPKTCDIKYDKNNPEKATDSIKDATKLLSLDIVIIFIALFIMFYNPNKKLN